MKKHSQTIRVILELLIASAILYSINYFIFKDFHHIAMFFTEDLAFIPIEVIVTVLIIEKELERRDKKKKKQKIYLLSEIFFEETGNELIRAISSKDRGECIVSHNSSKNSDTCVISSIKSKIENYDCKFSLTNEDVEYIFEVLNESKGSIIRFIENPYLDEHDVFTDLLQSAFHAYSDIKNRRKKGSYTKEDLEHISEDVSRLYKFLLKEWILYFEYIQNEYSYVYKLVLEDMPFRSEA